MTDDREAVDALICAFDSLTGLLYTLATDTSAHKKDDVQRDAALLLADRLDQHLVDAREPSDAQNESQRSAAAVRAALDLVAEAAASLADGLIDRQNVLNTLFVVVEEIGEVVDLRWLNATATPSVGRLLQSTVALIGELAAQDAADEQVGTGRAPAPPRPPAATLTMVLDENDVRQREETVLELYLGGVPYSVVETGSDGRTHETLWLPGMRRPLRREVAWDGIGSPRPVLTWEHHAALVAAADEMTSYAQLAGVYLGFALHRGAGDEQVKLLSQAADAIARS